MEKMNLKAAFLAVCFGWGLFSTVQANVAPVAIVKQPSAATYNSSKGTYTVAFDGSASYDLDAQGPFYDPVKNVFVPVPMLFYWSFGDGQVSSGADQQTVSHEYKATGLYTVSLWVHDEIDQSPVASIKIWVTHTLPDILQPPANFVPFNVQFPYLGEVGEELAFSMQGAIDPQNPNAEMIYGWDFADGCSHKFGSFYVGAMSPGAAYPPLKPFTWDGDGKAEQTQTLSASGAWIYGVKITPGTNCLSSSIKDTHKFQTAGTYKVTATGYTLLAPYTAPNTYNPDYSYIVASKNANVLINRRPIAMASIPASGVVGAPMAFQASGSYDPDGQPLTYQWDFGDGTHSTAVNPQHVFNVEGEYFVSLTVNDSYHVSTPVIQKVKIRKIAWLVPIVNLLMN
jgi:PKD repeat protein